MSDGRGIKKETAREKVKIIENDYLERGDSKGKNGLKLDLDWVTGKRERKKKIEKKEKLLRIIV